MAEWQATMSSHEFAEWMGFFQMHPFGEARADLRNASLMALISNVMTRTKHSDPVKQPGDFMPDFEQALDNREAEEEIPAHERLWQKIRSRFAGLVQKR